jgi:hypothetical protein
MWLICFTYVCVRLHSNQFKSLFQWELFQLSLFYNFSTNWKNNLSCGAIIENWFECKRMQLYVLHINIMNPYWKLNVWFVITCDLLERCIFYMPFCSSLHMTFIPSKYFWNLEVNGQTIPSWVETLFERYGVNLDNKLLWVNS